VYVQPAYPPPAYYAPQPAGPLRITDWEPGEPIPKGYHQVTRIRTGLVVGGAVTFGVVYLLTALGGAIASDAGGHDAKPLLIPVAGPFAVLGGSQYATLDFFLVLDGIVQAGGLAMLIAGIAAPRSELIRDNVGKTTFTLRPSPMTFGQNSAGFGLKGTF
jgi:hypothetical protein